MKKVFLLIVLFVVPITAYFFFASGVHNFARLPTLQKNISTLQGFEDLQGQPVHLKNKITILGFMGAHPEEMAGNAFNLNWVIYKPNYMLDNFQFIFLAKEGSQEEARKLYDEMNESLNMQSWNFAFGTEEEIKRVFRSLHTNLSLNEQLATPYVFIIDESMNLRGRDDAYKKGKIIYGYKTSDLGDIKNKMEDDVKVVLYESEYLKVHKEKS